MTSSSLVGTIIENKYSLDEQIGHGGMGAVFRGTQLMVDRTVAIKLLQAEFSSHDNFKARFEVEAKAIGRMNHPNCITLFDFGYSHNIEAFYTVVEYINGRSLSELLLEPTSLSAIISVIRQIAAALDHAHHHGILHRDLKPENIMLAQMTDGTEMVKVLDFGIAQILKGSGPSSQPAGSSSHEPRDDDFEVDRITRVGEVFGTPPYMSPEQARSTRHLTPACDLYSLGVIFYELVAGRLPFFSENPLDILLMHINEPPPPIKRLDSVPALHAVIMALLEKDPERRPQSGKELLTMLDAITPEMLGEGPAPSSQPLRSADAHHTPDPHPLLSTQPMPPPGVATSAANLPPLNRSWVETVDPGEPVPVPATFAPPPQARPAPKVASPSATAAPAASPKRRPSASPALPKAHPTAAAAAAPQVASPKPTPRRDAAFQTVISFDDIESQNASKGSAWGWVLLLLIACAALAFGAFQYKPELFKDLPFVSASQNASQQTPSLSVATAAASREVKIAAESARHTAAAYRPTPPQADAAVSANQDTPAFPEATRPATQKRQTSRTAETRKNRPATSPQKTDKIRSDDRTTSTSKGPRILEF